MSIQLWATPLKGLLEKQEDKLRKLSIEYDEELYPHMLSTVAERRWLISHGLRLAAMSTLESQEVRAVIRGCLKVPGYNQKAYEELVAAMERLTVRSVLNNRTADTLTKLNEGPYHTDLPTPDDICRFLQLGRVELNRTIKSQNVTLIPNQILTKELRQDMKRWEELIRENMIRLGGHWDHLPASLAHMLYCIVVEEQYNLAYFFVKRIKCARSTPTANLLYGMFLTCLYQYVMEHYPHLDNGIYNVVDHVMRPLALKQTRKP
ncbi:hypothetical protein Tco_1546311 [Tanacetum coccineum]